MGVTAVCTLRPVQNTINNGQKPDPQTKNLYYGDSWFASFKTAVALKEILDCEFVGPIKTAHKFFPKKFLEDTMANWPPGSHLVLRTLKDDNKYYAIGYKYRSKNVLLFIASMSYHQLLCAAKLERYIEDTAGELG